MLQLCNAVLEVELEVLEVVLGHFYNTLIYSENYSIEINVYC